MRKPSLTGILSGFTLLTLGHIGCEVPLTDTLVERGILRTGEQKSAIIHDDNYTVILTNNYGTVDRPACDFTVIAPRNRLDYTVIEIGSVAFSSGKLYSHKEGAPDWGLPDQGFIGVLPTGTEAMVSFYRSDKR